MSRGQRGEPEYDPLVFDEYSEDPRIRWRMNKSRAAVVGAGVLVGLVLAGVLLRHDSRKRKIDWEHTSPHTLAPEEKSAPEFDIPPHGLFDDQCAELSKLKRCSPSWPAARCVSCCVTARKKHDCAANPSIPICRSCCASLVSNTKYCGGEELKQPCTECCVQQLAKEGHAGCCNLFRTTKYCESLSVRLKLKVKGKEGCKNDSSATCVVCGKGRCQ